MEQQDHLCTDRKGLIDLLDEFKTGSTRRARIAAIKIIASHDLDSTLNSETYACRERLRKLLFELDRRFNRKSERLGGKKSRESE